MIFENGEPEDKQTVWNTGSDLEKQTALTHLTNSLSKKRWESDAIVVTAAIIGKAGFDRIVDSLKVKGVDTIEIEKNGIKVDIKLPDKNGNYGIGQFMDFIKNRYGVELDPEMLKETVQTFVGFEGLKWANLPKGANGRERNVIGDGTIWLDLDRIPLGTKSVYYENRKFILKMYDGTKMTIRFSK